MAMSTRAGLAVGALGVASLVVAVGVSTSHGQGDGEVRKAGASAAPTRAAAAPTPSVIGTIDMMTVFQGYEKAKFLTEGLKTEVLAKEGQLKGIAAEGKQIGKEMENYQPGTKDFKDRDAKLTQLRVKLEAEKQTAERETQLKQAEIIAIFQKEAQEMIARVAYSKGITHVLQVTNAPINTQDPDGVIAAMGRQVLYADPKTDITKTVLYNMNLEYQKAGGQVVKAPAGAAEVNPAVEDPAADAPAARPAAKSAARPAPAGNSGRVNK